MRRRVDRSRSAGEWLLSTARRNPEALLMLAAGCALLLRKGSSGFTLGEDSDDDADVGHGQEHGGRLRALREGVAEVAGKASEYGSEVSELVAGSARATGSAVSAYAEEGGRYIADRAGEAGRRARSAADYVLSEQPLAVAAIGLASGAVVAAMLPPTRLERRGIGEMRDTVEDLVEHAAENITAAAGQASRRMQKRAARAAKDLAWETAKAFASGIAGRGDDRDEGREEESGERG